MTKKEIIRSLAKDKTVEKLIGKKTDFCVEDLAQDIYIYLLEKPAALIETLKDRGELIFYITAIIKNQVFSRTSEYYKKYKSMDHFVNIDDMNI